MLVLITYLIYSLGLFFWSLSSIQYDSAAPAIRYGGALLLLGIFLWIISILDKKKMIRSGVTIMAVFINLGLSVAYRCTSEEALVLRISDLRNTYSGQTLLMIGAFLLIYCIVRFTRIYKTTLFNLAAGVSVLVVAFGARLGTKTGGSYLYFGNIMVFSWVLFSFPFIASYLLSRKEDAYVGRNVQNLSWNLFILLGYTFILYLASILNKEFGLVFLIGATTCVLFYVHCRNTNTLAKIFYTGICAAGALTAAEFVPHIRDRVQLWFHPELADSAEMKRKAEAVLYLFRYYKKNMGWYGRGIGTLSRSRVPTLRSDHVLLTLMNDYSILLVAMVLLLSVLLIRYLLISPKGVETFDRYLSLAIALTIGFAILLNVASVLGSFIQAGISFPWISASGGQCNLMFTALLAVKCGIATKGDDMT